MNAAAPVGRGAPTVERDGGTGAGAGAGAGAMCVRAALAPDLNAASMRRSQSRDQSP